MRRPDLFVTSALISGVMLLALFGLATTLFPGPTTIFTVQTVVFGIPLALIGMVGALIGRTASQDSPVEQSIIERLTGHPARVALFATVTLALVSFLVFRTTAYTMDEFANVFQARIFAAGHLAGSWPLELKDRMIAPAFDDWFILTGDTTGAVMGAYWPGLAAILAPFTLVGAAWMVGPLAGGMSVWLIGRIADRLAGPRAQAVAMLFTLCSAAFIFTSATLLPAGLHLAANMAFALLMLRGARRDLFAAALIGSLALNLHNPVPHMAFAAPWLVYALWRADRLRTVPVLVAGYLPGVILFVAWPLLRAGALGGEPQVIGGGDTIALTLAGVSARLWDLLLLWVWAAPALVLFAIVGLRTDASPGVRLLGASLLVTMIAYLLYPHDQGVGYGARYFHSAFGALPVIASVFLVRSGSRFAAGGVRAAISGAAIALPLVAMMIVAMMITPAISAVPGADAGPRTVRFIVGIGPADSSIRDSLLRNEPFSDGDVPLILISHGADADAAFMAEHFPGSHLVATNENGSAYEVP